MGNKYFIALFCMFLIITMPMAYAADGTLGAAADYTGEAASWTSNTASNYASGAYNFAEGLYYQYSASDYSGKYSEEGESIILEVLESEPKTIPASLIEEQDVPVYVKLGGIRSAPATMPKISFISFELLTEGSGKIENSTVGGTSDIVRRNYYKTYKYYKPLAYSLNDMGYLEIWLKQNTAEKKPKSIDLDFRAKIYYEAENLATLSGYLTGREFQVETEAEMQANLEIHKLFDNYYVRVDSVKSIESSGLYSNLYSRLRGNVATLNFYAHDPNTGKLTSYPAYTVKEGETSNMFRIADSPYFRIKVDDIISENTKFNFKINGEEVSVGMNEKISGSDWYVADYNMVPQYFATNTYVILKSYANPNFFIILSNLGGTFKSDKWVLTQGIASLEGIKENFNLVCGTATDKCAVYEPYKVSNMFVKADYSAALNSLSSSFNSLELTSVDKSASSATAQISTGTSLGSYSEGDTLPGAFEGCSDIKCKITSISGNSITISPEDRCDKSPQTMKVNAILPCEGARLVRINSDQKVRLTALPGSGKSISISDFSIHVPIEERMIELTPERIDKDINKSLAYIAKLDKSIIKLQSLVDQWTKVCLVTAAFFTVTSFFGGMAMPPKDKTPPPETATTAKKTVNIPSGKDYYYLKTDATTGKRTLEPITPDKYSIVEGNVVDKTNNPLFRVDSTNLIVLNTGVRPGEFNYARTEDLKKINSKYYINQEGDLIAVDPAPLSPFYSQTMHFDGKSFVFAVNSINQLPLNLQGFYNEAQTNGKRLYLVYDSTKDRCALWSGGKIDNKISLIDGQAHPGESLVIDSFASASTDCHKFRDQVISQISKEQSGSNQRSYQDGKYTLNTDALNMDSQPTCEQVLGTGSCKLLFNACDPVMCPSSRCNFGGKYKVENVIQSGLIGSLILCLPNIKQGIMMPVCLTGLLASLKNLRSVFQGYVDCLKTARIDKKSVGICDKIRSVYLCEIVWKELVTLLNLKGGLLGRFFGSSPGGNEYLSGVSSGLQQSKEFLSYFTQSYATTVFAAYKGRSAAEIGTEVCRSAIMGKYPVIGDVLSEVSAGQDVSQFTAYFEEEPYSPTIRGNSRYQVYYHIYAGGKEVNYQVYLKKDNLHISFKENRGTLTPGAYVDKSIDFFGVSNAKEICVLINNEEKCGYGKIVSTSFAMNAVNDFMVKYQMSQNIKSEDQCHSETWSSALSSGLLPNANVEKVCSQVNPAAGYEKATEAQWIKVGTCGIKDSVDLGDCWMKISDVPKELAQAVKMDICSERGGNICLYNQKCDGATEDVGTTVTCCKGTCIKAEYYSGAEGFDARYDSFNQCSSLKDIFDASALVVDQNCQRISSGLDTPNNLFSGLGNSELTGLVALRTTLEKSSSPLNVEDQLKLDQIYLFYIMMYLKCKDCTRASTYLPKISIKDETEFQTKLCIGKSQVNSLITSCKPPDQKPTETSSAAQTKFVPTAIYLKDINGNSEKFDINSGSASLSLIKIPREKFGYYAIEKISFSQEKGEKCQIGEITYADGTSTDKSVPGRDFITFYNFNKNECIIDGINAPIKDGIKFPLTVWNVNVADIAGGNSISEDFALSFSAIEQDPEIKADNAALCNIIDGALKYYFCLPIADPAYSQAIRCSDLEIKDKSIAKFEQLLFGANPTRQCFDQCVIQANRNSGTCLYALANSLELKNIIFYK